MGLSISVTVSGSQDFMQKVAGLGPALADFTAPLKTIGDELKSYYSGQVFESQGGVFGTPWAQLSPSTQVFKAKHYAAYAAVPLMATGTMRSSFRASVTPRRLVIDNAAPYFVYHQSSAPRSKLPRRPMLGVNEDVKQIIRQVITDDMHKKIGSL